MKLNDTLIDCLFDNDAIVIRNAADEIGEDEPAVSYVYETIELPTNEVPRFDENGNRLPSGPDDFAF